MVSVAHSEKSAILKNLPYFAILARISGRASNPCTHTYLYYTTIVTQFQDNSLFLHKISSNCGQLLQIYERSAQNVTLAEKKAFPSRSSARYDSKRLHSGKIGYPYPPDRKQCLPRFAVPPTPTLVKKVDEGHSGFR